jgi:hypothetical protein
MGERGDQGVCRLTVESEVSEIFFPTSLSIHSDFLSPLPEVLLIPGTTRGMAGRVGLVGCGAV